MEADFATLLNRHRRAAQLTQEMLAEKAGMSVGAVGALERGVRRFPRRETVVALADALGLAVDDRSAFALAARRRHGARKATIDPPPPAVPRQLPLAVASFTGRTGDLGDLRTTLTGGTTPAITVVTGMAGVGKTALAVQAAHAVVDEYPDGQVYLNLHGYGAGDPLSPLDALDFLLRAFGVSGPDVPLKVEEAAARLRTLLADRRALILLDNARAGAQVESLLPGMGRSSVIITSRHELSGIPAVHTVRLGLMSSREGIELLRTIVGSSRVDREPEAAQSILDACGLLPLALGIVAGRLAGRAHWPLDHLAGLLRDERRRLDQLEHHDLGVRASFDVSIDNLAGSDVAKEQQAAAAFVLLGLPDAPDLTADVAAGLLACEDHSAARILEDLCDLHLVESPAPGRYRLHDLLRTYARERAQSSITAQDRAAAITRIVDLYAATAWHALEQAFPTAGRLPWFRAQTPVAVGGPTFDSPGPALAWLDGQRPHLVALTSQAAQTPGVPAASILRLAIGLHPFYASRGHWLDCLRVYRTALEVATTGDDREAEGFIRNDLGLVLFDLVLAGSGDPDEAVTQLYRSLELFEDLADHRGAAMALANLSHAFDLIGDHQRAIDCGERALSTYRKLDDPLGEAFAYVNIGNSHGRLGRTEEQRAAYDQSIAIGTRLRGDHVLAIAFLGSGVAYREAGEYTRSLDHLHQAAAKFDALSNQLGLVEALDELGIAYRRTGSPATAIEHHEEALEIALQYDDGQRLPQILHHLALALDDSGDRAAAVTHLEEALTLATRRGLPNSSEIRDDLLRLTDG
ncbi:XRE family transcriptional regulator [Kribbella sancticallisti]|uniref:XRE family transcriptional regulator n=1 Tax=Kribbella sancticallisti TaxID=460087 RepID=A0ABN2EV19_9ACTN